MLTYYLTLFALALLSTWWIFKKVLRIALDKNIVDNPDARKLQKTPIPVLGGVAVFFGIIVSLIVTGIFYETGSLFAIMGVMTVMLYVGTMDDILSLSPKLRFFIEILVVLALIWCNGYSLNDFHGLWGIGIIPDWLAVPLTVFACVGIINAINLIDGVNGLSSGYCITACTLFAIVFIWAGDRESASLAVLSAGALIPFFCHNVFGLKSKMFIGDGGTLLMGTVLSTFVIGALDCDSPLAAKADPGFGMIPFTLAVLSVPVFDTLRVMSARIARGRSPFSPDRTHLHHLLFDLGFSNVGITGTELLSTLGIVGAWFLSYRLGASLDLQLYIVLALSFLATFGFYWWARRQQRRDTRAYHALQHLGRRTHVGHTRWFKRFRDFLDRGVKKKAEPTADRANDRNRKQTDSHCGERSTSRHPQEQSNVAIQ